jgi:uncharacterized cupredoxin-like copper-binding protein
MLEKPAMHLYSSFKTTAVSSAVVIFVLFLSLVTHAAGHHASGHGSSSSSHQTIHQGSGHGHSQIKHGGAAAIGEPGKVAETSRNIDLVMTDNRFAPESISVKKGETIRFRIMNKGEFVHEFSIGTAATHEEHQKEMEMMFEHGVLEPDKIHHDRMKMKMPDGRTMEHNDPNSVLIEPGKSAEIFWKFSTAAKLEFACNMPGHYQTGMMGPITIQ